MRKNNPIHMTRVRSLVLTCISSLKSGAKEGNIEKRSFGHRFDATVGRCTGFASSEENALDFKRETKGSQRREATDRTSVQSVSCIMRQARTVDAVSKSDPRTIK